MALHSGIDLIAVASFGVYTETYGISEEGNIANLIASFGYLEDAPDLTSSHKGIYRLGLHLTLA